MPIRAVLGPFVRGVWQTGANFWVELPTSGLVRIAVAAEGQAAPLRTATQRTVQVGRRFYAMLTMEGLKPAAWYTYRASVLVNGVEQALPEHRLPGLRGQLFRTLGAGAWQGRYRFAHASCRIARHFPEGSDKGGGRGPDVLSMLAGWLAAHARRRDAEWPRFLLLTGDQIYADECDDVIIERIMDKRRRYGGPGALPSLSGEGKAGRHGVHPADFEEYAIVYEHSWNFPGVQAVFANLPSFMAFDDHEVTDDWNITLAWQQQTRREPWRSAIVDALAAFWIYQGWANLDPAALEGDPRVQVLENAREFGSDALPQLEQLIGNAQDTPGVLRWYYQIRTPFPLQVADTRTERDMPPIDNLPAQRRARIMSPVQLQSLVAPLQAGAGFAFVVSPGPFLVWPLITVAGAAFRVGTGSASPGMLGRILGETVASLSRAFPGDLREAIVREADLEFWPAYFDSFEAVAKLARQWHAHGQALIFLSGDIHTALNLSAAPAGISPASTRRTPILQLISSSMQNPQHGSKRTALEAAGAAGRSASFGGLSFTYLPLRSESFFFDNNIGLIDLNRDGRGIWLSQKYLTVSERGELAVTRVMRSPAEPLRDTLMKA